MKDSSKLLPKNDDGYYCNQRPKYSRMGDLISYVPEDEGDHNI